MILDYQLIDRNPEGNVTGINISAIKYCIYSRIPYHADLHSYLEKKRAVVRGTGRTITISGNNSVTRPNKGSSYLSRAISGHNP